MALYNRLWEYWFAFQGQNKKKLSQTWLANCAGVSVFTIRKYLNNTITTYDARVVDRLCEVLEIPISDFFYRAATEKNSMERRKAVITLENAHRRASENIDSGNRV